MKWNSLGFWFYFFKLCMYGAFLVCLSLFVLSVNDPLSTHCECIICWMSMDYNLVSRCKVAWSQLRECLCPSLLGIVCVMHIHLSIHLCWPKYTAFIRWCTFSPLSTGKSTSDNDTSNSTLSSAVNNQCGKISKFRTLLCEISTPPSSSVLISARVMMVNNNKLISISVYCIIKRFI